MAYTDILKEIDKAIEKFNKNIPSAQQSMLDDVLDQVRRLDLKNGNIKASVANLKVVTSIKNKLTNIILTDTYLDDVKEFVKSFNDITRLQNDYWKGIESTFKPSPILKEIRNQAIQSTVEALTGSGLAYEVGGSIESILNTNVTTGGSMRDMENQLRSSLTNTQNSRGVLDRYAKQITTDSINQYSAQYTQLVSNDLGFEWYAYQGTDIKTTRPFCDAMTDIRYFHVSEIPRLLRAEDLYYTDNGQRKKVPIYSKTGLPSGMIEGTNPENFFIRRGGYNCGHQIRPVSEKLVPNDIKDRVFNTVAYQRWKSVN